MNANENGDNETKYESKGIIPLVVGNCKKEVRERKKERRAKKEGKQEQVQFNKLLLHSFSYFIFLLNRDEELKSG